VQRSLMLGELCLCDDVAHPVEEAVENHATNDTDNAGIQIREDRPAVASNYSPRGVISPIGPQPVNSGCSM
jgi:hypothetical protein